MCDNFLSLHLIHIANLEKTINNPSSDTMRALLLIFILPGITFANWGLDNGLGKTPQMG